MVRLLIRGDPVATPRPRADTALVRAKLAALVGGQQDTLSTRSFIHDGAPATKARARWSAKTRRFYTPKESSTEQESLALRFREASGGSTISGNVAIVAIFYRPNHQRIDTDNMMKLVMDAATQAGIWKDDCYVTAQASFVELDAANPRTLVAFCETTSTMNRDAWFVCGVCSERFMRTATAGLKNPPKFCSPACRKLGRDPGKKDAACPKCEIVFRRKTAGQRYCSRPCASSAERVRPPNAAVRPMPTCTICGGPVSRREYLRCSACSKSGRPKGDGPHAVVTVRAYEERP